MWIFFVGAGVEFFLQGLDNKYNVDFFVKCGNLLLNASVDIVMQVWLIQYMYPFLWSVDIFFQAVVGECGNFSWSVDILVSSRHFSINFALKNVHATH